MKNSRFYILNYFNFGYFLCIIPFRLEIGAKGHRIITNKYQKLCCGITFLFGSSIALASVIKIILSNSAPKVNSYFYIVDAIFLACYFFVFFRFGWSRSGSEKVSLIGKIQETPFVRDSGVLPSKIKKFIHGALLIAIVWICTLNELTLTLRKGPESSTKGKIWKDLLNLTQDLPSTILFWFGGLCFELIFRITEYQLCLTSLVFDDLVHCFFSYIDGADNDFEKISSAYDDLCELTRGINLIWGDSILLFSIVVSAYLAQSFAFITQEDLIEALTVLGVFLYYVYFIRLASEANRKVGEFKSWIFKRRKMLKPSNSDELAIFLNELSNANPGLSANGFFTLNYATLGSLIGFIVTYTIVILSTRSVQFRE